MPGVHSMGAGMHQLCTHAIASSCPIERTNSTKRTHSTEHVHVMGTKKKKESLYKGAIASSFSSYRENTFYRVVNTWGQW